MTTKRRGSPLDIYQEWALHLDLLNPTLLETIHLHYQIFFQAQVTERPALICGDGIVCARPEQ